MKLPIFVVDAFVTEQPFSGNPAAVCPLDKRLPDSLMQQIAAQNNLSETAFFVPLEKQGHFELRWFTPAQEVDLCGHATLASAFVIFEHLDNLLGSINFSTKSGSLRVSRDELKFVMDFPVMKSKPIALNSVMTQAIGVEPIEAYDGQDLLLVLADKQAVLDAHLNLEFIPSLALNRGLIITAKGSNDEIDFVSRYFAPELSVPEDPVTGSAHCQLAPIWSQKLNKQQFRATQLSARQGNLDILLDNERVILKGHARQYLHGYIDI